MTPQLASEELCTPTMIPSLFPLPQLTPNTSYTPTPPNTSPCNKYATPTLLPPYQCGWRGRRSVKLVGPELPWGSGSRTIYDG
ncbi:hypothetical protein E2C01_078231 [Portunus trituberculatus]|uniref:Uncharacterized protein n=1 Tax=Portunus trituberculatus TaxID=210409 RepID=A0A5B7INA2_PORTR|nr:hypothetical protein [Portunus trituberculatus]